MTQTFSHLMSPGQIGSMKLRNRIIMPPMIKNYATPDGFVTRQLIDHYAARAKGGAGLLIVEASYVHNTGNCWRQGIAIDDDHCIPGLANLTDAVKLWGSKIAIQLVHGGRQAQAIITKKPTIAPSAVTYPNAESMPREMTLQEITEMIESFAQATRRAKEAGFDAVELHGAHGYLISQFFSPNTNRRADKYGGDLKGRATFALEVIQRIRALVGPDYPILFRLNGEDTVGGGLTVADSRKLAQMLEKAGVNALHISVGTSEANQDIRTLGTSSTFLSPRGHLVDYAAGIKKLVKIPVITVSALTPDMAEDIIKTGKADFVSIGRSLIADPEFPNKIMRNQPETIRPCIRCNEMCRGRVPLSIRCSVNAEVGYESYPLQLAARKKKVMVIGGGPGGMEAARVAAMRGHEVTIFEKGSQLGGHLIEATVPPFKKDLLDYRNWLITQISESGIKVELNKEVTQALVKKEKPDVAIIATGSTSCIPQIPGIDKKIVTTGVDVLLGRAKPGNRPVIAGGGIVGSELALHLAQQGKKVTLVEMLPQIASDIVVSVKNQLTVQLMDIGVKIITNAKVVAITDNGVSAIVDGRNLVDINGDRVIIAMGMIADNKLYGTIRSLVPEVFLIGDGSEARRVGNAVQEGYRVASGI